MLRPDSVEMSVWGVASLAGLGAGVWSSVEEVIMNNNKTKYFRLRQCDEV